ncbi:transmembrane protein 192-like [Clytia hemisphaerica]|uniref:transmembrane protein 192-like n=1 Tax=Clytia hemisphaerica TaxID=252671 RepID=UPI0034D6753B
MVDISNTSGHQGSFSEHISDDHNHGPLFPQTTNDSTENLLIPAPSNTASVYSQQFLIRKFPGIIFVFLYLVIIVTFEVMAFVLYNILHVELLGGLDAPFAFLTVLHVGVWVLTFVYDRYLHFQHHRLRRAGYLTLYIKTKEIRKIPFMVFSIGNAALLLVVSFQSTSGRRNLMLIFQITLSAEVFLILVSTFIYLGYILKFNKSKKLPDVFIQDVVSGFQDSTYSNEVGFRDNECADDVLERQSEMIRYLRQHNMNLGKRIVSLTQMLPKQQQQNILNDCNVAPQLHPQQHIPRQ